MKNVFQKTWRYMEGINGLILILYVTCITSAAVFSRLETSIYLARWLPLIITVSILCCPLLMRAVRKIEFKDSLTPHSHDTLWGVLFFIIPFILFLIKYLVYYPIGFSPDTHNQYEQILANQYNDWHPVLQTLLAIKLPLLLTGGWIGSPALFQIIVFSSVLCYCLHSIRTYTGNKYAVLSMLFVMLNPQTTNIALFPWKDTSFAIGALLLLTYVLHIYFTDGAWIKKPVNTCMLILAAVLTTFFRHNAVLFTVPLLVAVFILIAKKRALLICLCVAVLSFGIKYPLYSALGVESPDQRQVETLGLPMNIIGAVVTDNPDRLDEETLAFAYEVAPKEVWEEMYSYGDFNSVKFHDDSDNDVIEKYGSVKVWGMALNCIVRCPTVALKSLIRLTEVVYSVSGDYIYYDLPIIDENPYGISNQGIPLLQRINATATHWIFILFPGLFMYIGSMHLILIVSALSKNKLNDRKTWKKLFILLPVFIYNFGTALLLTNTNDSSRFFYYTFLLMPTLAVFLFQQKSERGKTTT